MRNTMARLLAAASIAGAMRTAAPLSAQNWRPCRPLRIARIGAQCQHVALRQADRLYRRGRRSKKSSIFSTSRATVSAVRLPSTAIPPGSSTIATGRTRNTCCAIPRHQRFRQALIGFSRLLVVATDGSGVRVLDDRSGAQLRFQPVRRQRAVARCRGQAQFILMERVFQASQSTGTRTSRDDTGVGIEEVNLDTLYRSLFLKPRSISVGYLTDEKGDVRIMGTINRDPQGVKDDMEFAYCPRRSDFTELLPDIELEEFNVVGVDSGKNIAYALGEVEGFSRLYSVALNGTGKTGTAAVPARFRYRQRRPDRAQTADRRRELRGRPAPYRIFRQRPQAPVQLARQGAAWESASRNHRCQRRTSSACCCLLGSDINGHDLPVRPRQQPAYRSHA